MSLKQLEVGDEGVSINFDGSERYLDIPCADILQSFNPTSRYLVLQAPPKVFPPASKSMSMQTVNLPLYPSQSLSNSLPRAVATTANPKENTSYPPTKPSKTGSTWYLPHLFPILRIRC